MVLIGCLIVMALSLRAIYRQGWNRGFEECITHKDEGKLLMALSMIPIMGWTFDVGYDQGWSAAFDSLRANDEEG